MFLQIEKSVKAEVVKEQILSAIPEWDLRPGYVIIGNYGSVEKQEQDLLESFGSPTSDIPYGSEFRFAKDNLLLKRIWVNAPEENLESSGEIEQWLKLEPVEGLLRLLSPEMFDDKRSDYRWMSSDGKLLAVIEDTDSMIEDAGNQVAKEIDDAIVRALGERPMAIEGGPNPGRGQTGKTPEGNNNSGGGAKKPEPEGKKP